MMARTRALRRAGPAALPAAWRLAALLSAAIALLVQAPGCTETPTAKPPAPPIAKPADTPVVESPAEKPAEPAAKGPVPPPPEAPAPPPSLTAEYTFDAPADRGATPPIIESVAATPGPRLVMRGAAGGPADLLSKAGKGASGKPGDLAFDNSGASAMGGRGGAAVGGPLFAGKVATAAEFTFQGWFKTVAGQTIGGGAVLFSTRHGDAGVELLAKTNGTLTLWIGDGRTTREIPTPQVFTESGRWVFLAVNLVAGSTDAGAAAGPARATFYKGSGTMPVRQVYETAGADWPAIGMAGVEGLSIGARPDGSRAFRGWIDNVRLHIVGQAPAGAAASDPAPAAAP
ncbi:MAG: hypothetical protein IMZ66_11130 [Planctomycetes bacterium]|nr:hypothetical protein [Planctomycetota bacterium]